MNAIDTYFNGDYFRSRLEAKWAVFFTILGIPYEYEPQEFSDGNGNTYLPDFYLPNVASTHAEGKKVYIEVKHKEWTEGFSKNGNADLWFTEALIYVQGSPSWVFNNNRQTDYPYISCADLNGNEFPLWDNNHVLFKCENCLTAQFSFIDGQYLRCKCKDFVSYEITTFAEWSDKARFVNGTAYINTPAKKIWLNKNFT